MWRIFLLLIAALLLATGPAFAGLCGHDSGLKLDAHRGKLTDAQLTCLVDTVAQTEDPALRVDYSFVLIIAAYTRDDQEGYGQLMRTHLTQYNTTDAEVAYLYAFYLWKLGVSGDDALYWAKVALDNRRRWLKNRGNYDNMVKRLYDMLVEISMIQAIEVEQEYMADPSASNQERVDAYRRQARYWLIIAAPCLYYGDCGPYFEVEIEGWAPCDDLVALEADAKKGRIDGDQRTCLRSKYRKPQSAKLRILGILMDQADTEEEGIIWEELMAWHWNITGSDDALLAYRYSDFLAVKGAESAQDAMRWAAVALDQKDTLTGRSGRAAIAKLHQLRVATAERIWLDAKDDQKNDPSALHKEAVNEWKGKFEAAVADYQVYCTDSGTCK
jgi:hypothetical protein